MPIFFQHIVSPTTRIGIWKIEETEEFFRDSVPVSSEVSHPHKRLQHYAGRFLLRWLYPDFPYELIRIADTRKPFLSDEQYHFSISHCGDYAAAIVSSDKRVGIDIEIPVEKIAAIRYKFLSAKEHELFHLVDPDTNRIPFATLLWSAKESVFKWYGEGGVDFRKQIQLSRQHEGTETIDCLFSKTNINLDIHYRQFEHLVLAWVVS
jgi:phosphopantetheinyl transferase